MTVFCRRHSWVFVLCLLLGLGRATTAEVSRQPPDLYHKQLAPLLTPAEEVLATLPDSEKHAAAGHDQTVVLHEVLRRVDGRGAVLLVQHEIRRANTPDAVEDISHARFAFRQGIDSMHLVLARTLLPDGTRLEVPAASATIEMSSDEGTRDEGTRDEGASDEGASAEEVSPPGGGSGQVGELMVKFPRVTVGSAVEYIIVLEQPKPRIPGHFTALLPLDFPWPAGRIRHVVDLPAKFAARLTVTPVGEVPTATTLEVDGRRQIQWQKDAVPALHDALRRAIQRQAAAVWLTTLGDWDTLARWYRTLLIGRDLLPRELGTEVDRWTAEAATEEEVIEILHRKVADEVKFHEREFEALSEAPASAAQVWQARRGNGQDQANLLRAFLRHKGITSHLALVNTPRAGRFEARSPDYRYFDHVLLAVERDGGGILWCDPAAPQSRPGALPGGIAGRPVLVVRKGGHQLTTTPQHIQLPPKLDGSSAPGIVPPVTGTEGTESMAPGSFEAAVTEWIQNHGPPWFDFAQPSHLEDPRVGDPRTAISEANTVFNRAEKFKIALLAAQRGGMEETPGEAFFSYALLVLDELTSTWSAERKMLQAVMDTEDFPARVHQEAYVEILKNLFEAGLDDRLRQMLRHPVRQGLNPAQEANVARLAALLERPRTSTPQVEALLLDLAARPLDREDQAFFARQVRNLLHRGALDAVERIVPALAGLSLVGGDGLDASRLRLELLQDLAETRDQLPVAEALRREVFERFDSSKVVRPTFWNDLHGREALDLMPVDEALRGRLWELSSGELDLRLLPWWMGSMLLLVEPGAQRREFALQMTLAAARVAPDDATRLWFVLFGADVVGDDDLDRKRRFYEGLVAWSDPQQNPQVGEVLRVLKAGSALRQGLEPDLTTALVGLKQPLARRIASRLKVRQAYVHRDLDRLRFLLGELPSEHVLEPRTLDLHLPALRLVGMAPQEAAAREVGERALYEAMLRTWVRPERWEILLVFSLSEVLYDAPAYPEAWLTHCLERVGNRRMQHLIRLYDAELRGSWDEALGHAEALWAGDPEGYDFAWSVGRAAHRLGRWAQAREALEVFVAHAHDHLHRPEAMAMLAQVKERLREGG